MFNGCLCSGGVIVQSEGERMDNLVKMLVRSVLEFTQFVRLLLKTSGWEGLSSFLLALSPFSVFLCDFIIFPHFRTVTLGWAVRVVEGWHSSFSWLCLFLITPIWRSSCPAGIASARQQKNLLPVHPQMSAIEVLYNHKLQDLSSITLLPSAAGFVS